MKKILIVLTNVTRYAHTTDATGLWLGEATEFVETVQAAGYQVDYVSPHGGFVPLDPRSMRYTDEASLTLYESTDFQQRALTHSLRPQDVQASDYAAIYYTGGHGVMWDFPENTDLQTLSLAILQQGGFVTSVCHGIAGLPGSPQPKKSLRARRKWCPFSTKLSPRTTARTSFTSAPTNHLQSKTAS